MSAISPPGHQMVSPARIELATPRLKAECSTAELRGQINKNNMAEVVGFEPTHDGVKGRCLTAWLHPNKIMVKGEGVEPPNSKRSGLQPGAVGHFATPPLIRLKNNNGADDRNRTCNLRFTKPLLCRIEPHQQINGGVWRTWTADLLLVRQLLSQLS